MDGRHIVDGRDLMDRWMDVTGLINGRYRMDGRHRMDGSTSQDRWMDVTDRFETTVTHDIHVRHDTMVDIT